MHKHAESQITDNDEVIALFESALRSPEHRNSFRIVKGRAISTAEMLERRSMTTPDGELHIVGMVRVVDGERYWSHYYREKSDAISVFEHVAAEAKSDGTAK